MTQIKSDIQDVEIAGVSTRPVTINGAAKTAWDIETVGGPKVSTLDANLGNAAMSIQAAGQTADMNVTIKQNGNYTNYYLNTITPGKNSVSTPAGQAAVAAAQAQPPVSFDQFKSGEADAKAVERESIHRQVAAKVSASLMAPTDGPADFWANAEAILAFFRTGNIPGSIPVTNTLPLGGVTSHSAAGEQDASLGDEDIPF